MERIELESFFIELTNRCNFTCPFCPQTRMKRRLQTMPVSTAKNLIDQIHEDFRIDHIAFHLMGDPLLHPEWDNICRYAASRGLKTAIFTNGSLLTSETIKKIFNADISILVISYMGEIYKTGQFGNSKLFNRARYDNGIRKLLERKAALLSQNKGHQPRIEIHVFNTRDLGLFSRTVDIKTEQEIKDIFIRWIEFGKCMHEKYHLPLFENDPQKFEGFLNRPMYESNFHVIDEVSIVPKHIGTFANTIHDGVVRSVSTGSCDMFSKQMGVLSNGEVTFCCFDFEGVLSVGNIDTDSLVELWHSQEAQAYRQAFAHGELIHPYCQRCKGTILDK